MRRACSNRACVKNLHCGLFAQAFNASWFFAHKIGVNGDRHLDLVVGVGKHLFSDT
jgi:hypothetical protein